MEFTPLHGTMCSMYRFKLLLCLLIEAAVNSIPLNTAC